MSDDPIADEAWRREASHQNHPKNRPLLRPRGSNLEGLRGEEAFADRYGLAVDLTPRPGGDGGCDMKVTVWTDHSFRVFPVDCKAAVRPKDLIVEATRTKPEVIYVLCRYLEREARCTLLGWQWGRVLMRSEPKDYGYGVLNHWQPRGEIRTMAELDARVVMPDDDWELADDCGDLRAKSAVKTVGGSGESDRVVRWLTFIRRLCSARRC